MKNLVFAALLAGGLTQATGCIITSDDDDPVTTSSFLVTWNLESGLTTPPGAIGCGDAGVDTIRTISEPTGAAQIVDLFDCADGTHETAPLPLRNYTVWVEALDAAEALVAQSFASEETLFDANPVGVTFTFPVDIGYFGLTWTITENGSPATCGANDALSVLSTPVGSSGTGYDDIFDCVDGTGTTTAPLALDDYTVVVALLDDMGTVDTGDDFVYGQSEPRVEGIDFGNHLVDLGNFEFEFDAQ